MRFGFGLPHAGAAANGPDIIRFAQRAEALGFESLWRGDHLVLPWGARLNIPIPPMARWRVHPLRVSRTLYPFVICGGRHQDDQTGDDGDHPPIPQSHCAGEDVGLYRRPLRRPPDLRGWRGMVGEGISGLTGSYKDRGPVSDEYREMCKILWTQDHPEFHGKFYDFDGITMYPKPVQQPSIPIWVGGHSRRASAGPSATARPGIRRGRPPTSYSSFPYLRQESERLGRDPRELTISLNGRCTSPISDFRGRCCRAQATPGSARLSR